MRGYFGIGVVGVSKPMNVGNLVRSAHAFGASFIVLIDPYIRFGDVGLTDTADTEASVPVYAFADLAELTLPRGCQLVGVEFVPGSVPLPSFRHPRRSLYLLGPELDSLGPETLQRCHHTVKIPARFAINVATAGALVMYDRVAQLGGYEAKPVMPGGPPDPDPAPTGGQRYHAEPAKVPRD